MPHRNSRGRAHRRRRRGPLRRLRRRLRGRPRGVLAAGLDGAGDEGGLITERCNRLLFPDLPKLRLTPL